MHPYLLFSKTTLLWEYKFDKFALFDICFASLDKMLYVLFILADLYDSYIQQLFMSMGTEDNTVLIIIIILSIDPDKDILFA